MIRKPPPASWGVLTGRASDKRQAKLKAMAQIDPRQAFPFSNQDPLLDFFRTVYAQNHHGRPAWPRVALTNLKEPLIQINSGINDTCLATLSPEQAAQEIENLEYVPGSRWQMGD